MAARTAACAGTELRLVLRRRRFTLHRATDTVGLNAAALPSLGSAERQTGLDWK